MHDRGGGVHQEGVHREGVTQENNTMWFASVGLNLVASTWIYTKTILCDGRGAGETRFRTCSQIRHHCGKCTLGN